MLTNHTSHECKKCKEKLPSVTKLLKHVADNHYEGMNKTEPLKKILLRTLRQTVLRKREIMA